MLDYVSLLRTFIDKWQKKKDQERNKELRRNNRIQKLRNVSRSRFQSQIDNLQGKPDLSKKEQLQLDKLKDDLDFMVRNNIGKVEKDNNSEDNDVLGDKSIFYAPDWNIDGAAPPGCRNVRYNEPTFVRRTKIQPRTEGLSDIRLP